MAITEQERAELAQLSQVVKSAQAQQAADVARAEPLKKQPTRTASQFAAWQAHVANLWEIGGKQKRNESEAEQACETCKGARWLVRRDVHPAHGSASVRCPDCWHTWWAAQIARRWRLTDEEKAIAAKPFRARREAPEMANVYRTVKAFGDRVISGGADMLAITGPVGIGKTHLGLRLHAQVLKGERGAIFRTATSIQKILQNFGHDDESRREANHRRDIAMKDLTTTPLLILDEAERATGEWYENQMLDIINIRRANRLATVLLGNNLYLLPAPILSRARSRGCDFIELANVPDARAMLGGREL